MASFPGLDWSVPGWDFAVGCPADPDALADPATIPTSGAAVIRSGQKIRLVQAGATLDGYDLRHGGVDEWHVVVEADDCTVKNCYVTDNAQVLIDQLEGVSGLVVEDCTFDGLKEDWSPFGGPNPYVQGRDGAITVRRCLFIDLQEDAIRAHGGGLIEDNCIIGSGWQTGGHCDAIHCGAGGGLIIRHNFVDWTIQDGAPAEPNNAVRIVSEFGAIDDVLVEENLLIGSATYLFEVGIKDATPITNVVIQNNLLLPLGLGELYPQNQPEDLEWTGNTAPPMPRGWFVAGYDIDTSRPFTPRYCTMQDHHDEIAGDSGAWAEAEIAGDQALVKVCASFETLAALPFERVSADVAAEAEPLYTTIEAVDGAVP